MMLQSHTENTVGLQAVLADGTKMLSDAGVTHVGWARLPYNASLSVLPKAREYAVEIIDRWEAVSRDGSLPHAQRSAAAMWKSKWTGLLARLDKIASDEAHRAGLAKVWRAKGEDDAADL